MCARALRDRLMAGPDALNVANLGSNPSPSAKEITMKQNHWWTWHWDNISMDDTPIPYRSITRWRRGWITLYKMDNDHSVEWRLYFPFNISIGIQLRA